MSRTRETQSEAQGGDGVTVKEDMKGCVACSLCQHT
jgi:hypothetical protein